MRFLVILFSIFLSSFSGTQHEHLCNFLPENNLYLGTNFKSYGGVTEQEFNNVLDEVEAVYAPIISSKGGRLVLNRLWSDGKVNASATRQGSNYIVDMYGGLARYPAVTRDALALVTCHEVGHHLGGAPKYSDNQGSWAAVEGQADYFSVSKCLRKVFSKYPATPGSNSIAEQECQKYQNGNVKNLCVRTSIAGLEMSKAMAQMGSVGAPRLDLKDPKVVSVTYEQHPQPQCRLDTYFQGSLCDVNDNTNFDDRDPNKGACLNGGAQDYGSRPLCWYKPGGSSNPPNPPGNGNPGNGIAKSPSLNGSSNLQIQNPNTVINVEWNVQGFANAYGVYVEFGGMNQDFSNPNGTTPDPKALGGSAIKQLAGRIQLVPRQHLPGPGRYQVRVIPLDGTGRKAVGRFSNPAVLEVLP